MATTGTRAGAPAQNGVARSASRRRTFHIGGHAQRSNVALLAFPGSLDSQPWWPQPPRRVQSSPMRCEVVRPPHRARPRLPRHGDRLARAFPPAVSTPKSRPPLSTLTAVVQRRGAAWCPR